MISIADTMPELVLVAEEDGLVAREGERVLAEIYLAHLPILKANPETALDLIFSEIALRAEHVSSVIVHSPCRA